MGGILGSKGETRGGFYAPLVLRIDRFCLTLLLRYLSNFLLGPRDQTEANQPPKDQRIENTACTQRGYPQILFVIILDVILMMSGQLLAWFSQWQRNPSGTKPLLYAPNARCHYSAKLSFYAPIFAYPMGDYPRKAKKFNL